MVRDVGPRRSLRQEREGASLGRGRSLRIWRASRRSRMEVRVGNTRATAFRTDVSSRPDVEAMVAHAMETFGRLDYAVNNAAIEGKCAAITDLSVEEWDAVMGVNLRGAFVCVKYEAAAMLDAPGGGAIVFFCSEEASDITGATLTPDGGFTLTV